MWHDSLNDGCSEAASPNSGSALTRRLSSWRCSITPRATSRGSGRRICAINSLSLDQRSRKRRRTCLTSACSRCTRPDDKALRNAGELFATRRNMPVPRASRRPEMPGGRGISVVGRCLPGGPEGKEAHVRRSAAAVRALPGARRSLRSLCSIRLFKCAGNLAMGARSRLRRLSASLADEESIRGDLVSEPSARACALAVSISSEVTYGGQRLVVLIPSN